MSTAPTRGGWRVRLAYAAILTAAAALFTWNLGGRPLENWDEAIYAQVAREVLQTGDWVTLHWNFQPWYLKPPLYVWLEAVLFRLTGVGEVAARLPSALAGVALVGVTMAIARRLRARPRRSSPARWRWPASTSPAARASAPPT